MSYQEFLKKVDLEYKKEKSVTALQEGYLAATKLYPKEIKKLMNLLEFDKKLKECQGKIKKVEKYQIISSINIIEISFSGKVKREKIKGLKKLAQIFDGPSNEFNIIMGAIVQSQDIYEIFLLASYLD